MSAAPKQASSSKAPVAQSTESVRDVRKACQNTLHLAMLLWTDPTHRLKAMVLTTLAEPFRKEHGAQSKNTRSHEACLNYWSNMSVGEGSRALKELVELVNRPATLEAFGLKVVLPDWMVGSMNTAGSRHSCSSSLLAGPLA